MTNIEYKGFLSPLETYNAICVEAKNKAKLGIYTIFLGILAGV